MARQEGDAGSPMNDEQRERASKQASPGLNFYPQSPLKMDAAALMSQMAFVFLEVAARAHFLLCLDVRLLEAS